jgi:hypothetical protein
MRFPEDEGGGRERIFNLGIRDKESCGLLVSLFRKEILDWLNIIVLMTLIGKYE